uniref:RxLR effector PexRD54 WY domain-containing protein n=1 Tax=Phytophthora ramorum TaxID=164328 RepID=H3GFB8_PHYRM
MVAKFSPCSLRRCTILLTILALLACVGTVSGATDANIAKPETLDRSEGRQLRGFLRKRSLRTVEEAMKDDDDSEERAITDAVKKMAQAAKNKLTSNNQATTNKLFKKLQVGEIDDKLFQSTQFKEWVTTVTKNFKTNTELAQASIASALVSHFGDEALATLLVAAKQNYKSATVATKLENAQLRNWESAGKTGDDVFDLLKLNDKGEKLFESPVAATWISYVTKLNTQNSDEVIFSSLKKLFDDEALAKMIAGAKDSASTAATATKLEQVQLNKWMVEGKTVDDIFALLKLNNEEGKLLQNTMLTTWMSYVNLQGKNPYDMILVKLSAHYDEAGLAKMLVTAKQDGTAFSIVRKLEEVQFKNWLSDGKTADDVYNLLKLNLERGDILKSPMLTTWISYTAKLDENPYQLLLALLMKQYDDATLTKMFVAAKRGRATESIGTKLEEVQLKSWLSDGKTADDVFKLLQLNKDGDTIFASSVWSVWSSYLTKLDKENVDELMFVVLKKHYGGDEGVAKMVTIANKEASTKDIGRKLKEELWRSQGKDGDDVFKLLKLDEEGQKFFESPALSTWVSYVSKLNKQNPGAISQLEKRFGGDIELARMIGFAKQQAANAVTEKVITQLQNLQFKQWLGDGRTLNTISDKMVSDTMVSALFDTRNTKVILDYSDFLKASAARTG